MGIFDRKLDISITAHNQIFTSIPPQMKIIKTFGLVKATTAEISAKYHNEDDELLSALLSEATRMGANAIINFRYTSGSYQRSGHGFITSYLIATGDAVLLEGI
ncbi:heavy metal-binding domain-containing protein [Salmonella enterica]|nr:heavy metal-binding domain-containing protein [Salmonella enterica]